MWQNRLDELYGMFFFHFVSQEELIVSKVIFAMYKIDCEGKLSTCLRFLEIFRKMELADNITERCQRYKMNKQSAFHQILATSTE